MLSQITDKPSTQDSDEDEYGSSRQPSSDEEYEMEGLPEKSVLLYHRPTPGVARPVDNLIIMPRNNEVSEPSGSIRSSAVGDGDDNETGRLFSGDNEDEVAAGPNIEVLAVQNLGNPSILEGVCTLGEIRRTESLSESRGELENDDDRSDEDGWNDMQISNPAEINGLPETECLLSLKREFGKMDNVEGLVGF